MTRNPGPSPLPAPSALPVPDPLPASTAPPASPGPAIPATSRPSGQADSPPDAVPPDAVPPEPVPPEPVPPELRVRVGSPLSLLAVVPCLLMFEPADSIVVIGTGRPGGEVQLTLRYDLPDPAVRRGAAVLADGVTGILAAQGIATAAVVCYGPDRAVTPVAAALRSRAAEAGITLTEVLRAEDGRYWSYVCSNPDCCPPEGTPFDLADHPATRAFAASGRRVLASRQALAATIAPAKGDLAAAMRSATEEAEREVAARVGRMVPIRHRIVRRRLVAAVGQPMTADAIRRYRAGETIDTDVAGWLMVALRELRVRDDAWARMLPEYNAAHTCLWADLTRLAPPGYVAAPATLLAFVAWQAGDGALGNVALDRALADDRTYSMARLVRRALDCGAPPSMARLPMTPDEVAATYDAQEAAAAAEAGIAAVAG